MHLDYIPVAQVYKIGLKTRNSLTIALQEQGVEPDRAREDNETMHWQERERAWLTDLCKEEIEILMSKKTEAESFIASVGEQVSEYKEELADQKVAFDDIK